MKDVRTKLLVAALGAAVSLGALAQKAAPVDQPYPGMLTLKVDLTDAPKKIFRVHETIPAAPGPLTLYYPQWIPGEHSPSGPIQNVAGVVIRANGKRVAWRRDLRDMYALHLEVPAGANQVELEFQFLSPGEGGFGTASASSSSDLVDVEFNQVAFYPAGYYTRQIRIQPTVVLPAGWQFATAMDTTRRDGATVVFEPLPFNTFVDSPLIAGRYFNRVDLKGVAPVHLNVVSDQAELLQLSDGQLTQYRALVEQTERLFGAHHFDHYDFLLTLSDQVAHFGLEHHRSSDDRLSADLLGSPKLFRLMANLMPHEYVHSWCGKYRRPASLWAPDFNTVEQNDLQWVYEGLTHYWAGVLTARSGMWTAAQYRDDLANTAAEMGAHTGRAWRSLQDTADAASLTLFASGGWMNWRRSADFYPEGQLLWLDVDTQIRQLSGGKRSLDDFARAFFGMDNGSYTTKTYTFDDVVAALNGVQPYDWTTFLRSRLDATGEALPEHGIERGGWSLVYTDKPNSETEARESLRHNADLAYSLGLSASKKGNIYDVQWGGPAFEAGLVPGLTLVAVNGKDYSPEALKDAVVAAKAGPAPIELLVKNVDVYSTVRIDYHGGLKYPHLVRADGKDLLTAIAAPRK